MTRKPTNRSHGEGSIYRSDYTRAGGEVSVERWVASVDLGIGPNGKRLRKKVTGPTRTAVADKLRERQRQQEAKVDLRKKSMTVADLAEEWLTHLEHNEGTKEEGTILRLRPRVMRHIIPAGRIGGRQLDQLTVAEVESWLKREALSGGHLDKPQTRITCRDYRQSKAKVSYTSEQYARLIAVLTAGGNDALKTATPSAYFIAMLSTGARPGEIDALRWDQVDFDHRSITIDHAMKRADGGRPISIGETKTGNRRDVEMTDVLLSSLRRHRTQQVERRLAAGPMWTGDPRWADLVFTSEVGTPVDPSHARRDFKTVCAHAEVPELSLYEMRHTVASLMVDADVPLREVADLLGHKDMEMVVRRYRHQTDGIVTSHVAVLGALVTQ